MARLGVGPSGRGREDDAERRLSLPRPPKRTHEPFSGDYPAFNRSAGFRGSGTPLMLVLTFKEDRRLPPRFLTRNQFVGVLQGRYDPVKRRWHA